MFTNHYLEGIQLSLEFLNALDLEMQGNKIEVAIPGVKKTEIKLVKEGTKITLTAESKDKKYKYKRVWYNRNKIESAQLENGILTIKFKNKEKKVHNVNIT